MKKLIAIILVLSSLLLGSCKTKGEDVGQLTETDAQSADSAQTDGEMTIISGGKTEYVIVYNFSDRAGRDFADSFLSYMNSTFGVYFNVKSQSESNDKEIIIGDTSREATLAVKAQMNQTDDYAVCAVDNDLVLYATDASQYAKLLIALRDYVFADTDTSELKFNKEKNFIASLNPDMVFGEDKVLFVDKGSSAYKIVYKANDPESMTYAMYLKEYLQESFGISIPIQPDTKQSEKEILIKGANRSVLRTAEQNLASENDFLVSISGDDILVSATDSGRMILAMMKLVDQAAKGFNGTQILLSEKDNYVHSRAQNSFEYSAKELCERYQSVFNTYSSYHEAYLYGTSWVPQSAKDDQMLVEALIDRMGTAFAVSNGSSSVLYDGFVRKLDTEDYTRSAIIDGTTVKIPKQFAESYFGATPAADHNGYVDLTSYLSGNAKYSIYISADGKLAIITPASVASFANGSTTVGGYTNTQYCKRMLEFFYSPVIPEPGVNTEQTRVVIEHIPYPEYVLDYKTQIYQTTYSPGIIVVNENGKNVYYVSYEVSTVRGGYEELDTYTVVKKSTDGGETWSTVVNKIPGLVWGSIFENKGIVYLLGCDNKTFSCVIVKVNSNGTFEKVELYDNNVITGSAPGVVLHANGRIYKAYSTAVLSAPENSNLMLSSSWTVSNATNVEELALAGGEGSMVLGKDGQVYQISRGPTTQTVYLLKVSADGTTVTGAKPSTDNVIEFPTCITKTSFRYDEVSGKYIALANICNSISERQRNVLALVVSDDLYHWEIAEYILVEREMINPIYSMTCHAFQYADFAIDGDDVVMAIRETAGYTNTYHDGNYTTFYRLENFRDLLDNARGDYPA